MGAASGGRLTLAAVVLLGAVWRRRCSRVLAHPTSGRVSRCSCASGPRLPLGPLYVVVVLQSTGGEKRVLEGAQRVRVMPRFIQLRHLNSTTLDESEPRLRAVRSSYVRTNVKMARRVRCSTPI